VGEVFRWRCKFQNFSQAVAARSMRGQLYPGFKGMIYFNLWKLISGLRSEPIDLSEQNDTVI
jgi:hypothetical protein